MFFLLLLLLLRRCRSRLERRVALSLLLSLPLFLLTLSSRRRLLFASTCRRTCAPTRYRLRLPTTVSPRTVKRHIPRIFHGDDGFGCGRYGAHTVAVASRSGVGT